MQVTQTLVDKLKLELGDGLYELVTSPDVTEVIRNPDGSIFVERPGRGMSQLPPDQEIEDSRVYNFLATTAALYNRHINHENAILEVHLPFGGERLEGMIPPVVAAPSFAIRRHTSLRITLTDYVNSHIISASAVETLRKAIASRENILIVGGTGSGKTTLINALLAELAETRPDERLVVIEDTRELRIENINHTRLETSLHANQTRLLAATMRLRPDRIIVGEVRDGAALALLKAWGTGHPGGLATVHADSAVGGLGRLELLIGEATTVNTQIRQLIGTSIDLIVFIERAPESKGRRVREITRCLGYDSESQTYNLQSLYNTLN